MLFFRIPVTDSSDNKSSQRRHKKHKHKKHKKRKLELGRKGKESAENVGKAQQSSFSANKSPSSIKLKIKIHEDEEKETAAGLGKRNQEVMESPIQKYVDKIGQGLGLVPSSGAGTPSKGNSAKKKRSQKKDSETSSEEERWLDAIQSGKLDEVKNNHALPTKLIRFNNNNLHTHTHAGGRGVEENQAKGSETDDSKAESNAGEESGQRARRAANGIAIRYGEKQNSPNMKWAGHSY